MRLAAPRAMAVAPAPSALSRTLRRFVSSSSAYSSGHLAGVLRLAQLRRPALGRQHGSAAFSTSRTCQAASAASVTEVETQPQPQPAGSEAGGAVKGGVYQSTAYPFTDIEAKWQAFWDEHKTFRTPDITELDTSKPKFYALDMFPYPR